MQASPWCSATRRRGLRCATVLVVLAALAGCGGPDHSGASRAAAAFQQAVTADPGRACALLSARARAALESEKGTSCADAITGVGMPAAGPVLKADVYGGNARITTEGDVLFLARFSDGWKVTAAGCTAQPSDAPYDRMVSGG